MQRGAPAAREELFIQFDGNGARGNFQRCLVRGPHKLIVDLFKDEIFFELYDVLADPQEQQNLAWDQPQLVQPLLDALRARMQGGGDLLQIPASAYERFRVDYGPDQAIIDY